MPPYLDEEEEDTYRLWKVLLHPAAAAPIVWRLLVEALLLVESEGDI